MIIAILLGFLGWYLYERSQRRTHPMTPGLHAEIDLPHTQEWEIYQNSLSICSKKLRVCMEELRLPHLSHHIDLIETGSYENLSRRFLKVNPGFSVPVLVHNGHPVYESHDQIVYAAAHAGAKGAALLGETAELRAEVARWVDLGALKGNPLVGGEERAGNSAPGLTIPIFASMLRYIPWWRLGVGVLFHGQRRRPILFSILKLRGIHGLPPPAREAIRRARRNMSAHLDTLEQALADGRAWVCGETFTLADVSWMAILERLCEVDWIEVFLGQGKRPGVAAYWRRVQKRPSYEAALQSQRGDIAIRALQDLKDAKRSSPELREALEVS
ncbi:MAG: glutathione S-transferase C-terminal domain-containing protein [Myxococcales bacterium]|nr:glutathione S-transferase C-terminal domain-containing protein [Myxococcales bacterium]